MDRKVEGMPTSIKLCRCKKKLVARHVQKFKGTPISGPFDSESPYTCSRASQCVILAFKISLLVWYNNTIVPCKLKTLYNHALVLNLGAAVVVVMNFCVCSSGGPKFRCNSCGPKFKCVQ